MQDNKGDGGYGWNQIFSMMGKVTIYIQAEKIRNNGRENVDSVLISRIETSYLMDLSPSHAEE